MNDLKQIQPAIRWLSYGSFVLAILGVATYWWVPMGMVLSLAGLMLGIIDWIAARRRSFDYRSAIVGTIACAIVLACDCLIAYFGWQTVTFGGG